MGLDLERDLLLVSQIQLAGEQGSVQFPGMRGACQTGVFEVHDQIFAVNV